MWLFPSGDFYFFVGRAPIKSLIWEMKGPGWGGGFSTCQDLLVSLRLVSLAPEEGERRRGEVGGGEKGGGERGGRERKRVEMRGGGGRRGRREEGEEDRNARRGRRIGGGRGCCGTGAGVPGPDTVQVISF